MSTAAPDHRERWMLRNMAVGFGIGSALFAAGTVVGVLQRSLQANVVFMVGAICFTVAATVQWRASLLHRHDGLALVGMAERDMMNPDWTAAIVQLAGTVAFNIMTVRAVVLSLGDPSVNYQGVWAPDIYGSALFLISSWIALRPIARQRRHRLVSRSSFWICVLNLFGSIFFGISAVAAMLTPEGTELSVAWNNLGTFIGALGFLAASLLLWPPRARR